MCLHCAFNYLIELISSKGDRGITFDTVILRNGLFFTALNQSAAGEGNAEADDTVHIEDVTSSQIADLEETGPASAVEPGAHSQSHQVKHINIRGMLHNQTQERT